MVEFISEAEATKIEEPLVEAPELESTRSLEALVEEQVDELQSMQSDQDYVDEPSVQGEYHQPQDISLKEAPDLKHELKPMIYDEREQVIVVDIFERYGKNDSADDKWWKHLAS